MRSVFCRECMIFAASLTATTANVQAQSHVEATVPVVRIGAVAGDPMHELYNVVDVDFVNDTLIAVGSSGTLDIRVFNLRGQAIASWGRRGGAPGELRALMPRAVHVARDSIWVFDPSLERVSVISAAGKFGRSISLRGIHRNRLFVLGVFPDGTLLLQGKTLSPRTTAGWTTITTNLLRYESGKPPVFLTELFWGTEYIVMRGAGGGIGWAAWQPPGAIQAQIAIADLGFWYADGRRAVVERRRAVDAKVEKQVPVVASHLDLAGTKWQDAQRKWFREMTADSRQWLQASGAEFIPPEILPRGVVTIVPDNRGGFWYRGHHMSIQDAGLWHFVDKNSAQRVVQLPAGFELYSVKNGLLAGIERDVDGVEFVAVYRVRS
jgi:hypothetical protein